MPVKVQRGHPMEVTPRRAGEDARHLGWLGAAGAVTDDVPVNHTGSETGNAEVKPASHPNGPVAESSRAANAQRVGYPNGGALRARTRVALFRPGLLDGRVIATIHWR